MTLSDYIRRLLGILGTPDDTARVRMGRGVVGNTTYGFLAMCAAFIGVMWALRDDPIFAIGGGVVIGVLYLFYLIGTYRFADKHPDRAMLGDTEWLQWSQNQAAAKDKSLVLDQMPTIGTSDSTLISRDGGDDA